MKYPKDKTLILSGRDVQRIVSHCGLHSVMDTLIERLTIAIKTFNPNETAIPVRSGFHYEQPNSGLIEWMPLYNEGENVLLKVVGYHPKNSEKYNLPTIISTISTYDTESGHLSAVMDGVLATALRTGAASAVASNLMAQSRSSTLGLIGCGTQAITQIHGLSRIFDLKRILVSDSDPTAVSTLKSRSSMLGLEIEIESADIRNVVENADILCTATSIDVGAGPLFENIKTKSHLHINAVGSDFPGKIEIPLSILNRSFVCPDFAEQALIEGECQQLSADDIDADLVELVRNQAAYKFVKDQQSVFDSTGWALEDNVVMELFLEYAFELGLGFEIEIEANSKDARSPYHFLCDQVISVDINEEVIQKEMVQTNQTIQ